MLELKRVANWRTKMQEALDANQNKPFIWGETDCAFGLAGDHVLAITGYDLMAPYKGKYTTALGAVKALKAEGYSDLLELCQHNFPMTTLQHAHVGDIGAIVGEFTGWTLCVYLGARVIVQGQDCRGTLPRSFEGLKYAFRIG